MAIFHFTVKIIGRSKGRSVISASAYLNGDVMKNEETGELNRYTSKKEVVFSHLSMCANAPPEWQTVPEENIKRFMNSTRYKHAEDKGMALRKFKTSFQKQQLWNEVLKVEKSSDAQLTRSFEFSLPHEWARVQQIQFANLYIRRNFVEKGMCADWSIHDSSEVSRAMQNRPKGDGTACVPDSPRESRTCDGNPHVHLLVTMRPFNPDHTWGSKEMKDWAFVRGEQGNPVIDPSHPDWWQDKKNPERCGIRIPLLDSDGNQKTDFGIEAFKRRIAEIADIHTRYERIAADFREAESTRGRDPALEDLCSEYEQRKRDAAETERRIAAINQSRSRSGQTRSKDGQSVLITNRDLRSKATKEKRKA